MEIVFISLIYMLDSYLVSWQDNHSFASRNRYSLNATMYQNNRHLQLNPVNGNIQKVRHFKKLLHKRPTTRRNNNSTAAAQNKFYLQINHLIRLRLIKKSH